MHADATISLDRLKVRTGLGAKRDRGHDGRVTSSAIAVLHATLFVLGVDLEAGDATNMAARR